MAIVSGFGIRLQRGDGASPEAFTTITGITNIEGPNQSHPVIERTNNDDLSGARSKWVRRGWTDEGQIVCTGMYEYNVAVLESTEGDLEDTTAGNWRIVDASATSLHTFAAFVTNFNRSHPFDNIPTYQITFQIDGTLTIA